MYDANYAKCARKVRHLSFRKAYVAAKRTGDGVEPYYCHRCDGYHVGKPNGHDLKAMFHGSRRACFS